VKYPAGVGAATLDEGPVGLALTPRGAPGCPSEVDEILRSRDAMHEYLSFSAALREAHMRDTAWDVDAMKHLYATFETMFKAKGIELWLCVRKESSSDSPFLPQKEASSRSSRSSLRAAASSRRVVQKESSPRSVVFHTRAGEGRGGGQGAWPRLRVLLGGAPRAPHWCVFVDSNWCDENCVQL
jgi:hypothetical protein